MTESIEAGRELDTLIAEKVMGWELYGVTNNEHSFLREGVVYKKALPRFSTDIAAAWLVVEKIHSSMSNESRDGKRMDLNYLTLSVLNRYGDTAASFDLELTDDWFEDIDSLKFAARAATPPLAICLAALKALNV